MTEKQHSGLLSVIRWTARILSAFFAAVIVAFFIGEGLSDGADPLRHLSIREILMFAAFIIVWLGLLSGWKFERAGGIMILGGTASFYLINYVFSGRFPGGPYFLLLLLPGVLFLYCGLRRSG